MKNVTLFLLALIVFYGFSSVAQTKGLYFSKVTTLDSPSISKKVIYGYLYEVNDSTIVLANIDSRFSRIVQKKMTDGDFQKTILRYANIEKISLKRLNRGRFLKIFLGGLASSVILLYTIWKPDFGIGRMFGGVNYRPQSDNTELVVAPVLLSIPLGVLSGSLSNNIAYIYGNYSNFEQSKSELQKISFIQIYQN